MRAIITLIRSRIAAVAPAMAVSLAVGCVLAYGASRDNGLKRFDVTDYTMLSVFPEMVFGLGLVAILCILMVNDTSKRGIRIGFPEHLKSLPVSTPLLALAEVLSGVALVGFHVLVSATVLDWMSDRLGMVSSSRVGLWQPWFWVASTAWAYGLVWTVGSIHVLLVVAGFGAWYLCLGLLNAGDAGLAFMSALGLGLAMIGARLSRRGTLRPVRASVETGVFAGERASGFFDAVEAQAWFESRRSGRWLWLMFGIALMVTFVPRVVIAFPEMHTSDFNSINLRREIAWGGNAAIGLFLLTAWLYGALRLVSRTRALWIGKQPFGLLQPLPSAAMSNATLRAQAIEMAGPWVIVILVNALDVFFVRADGEGSGIYIELLRGTHDYWFVEVIAFAAISLSLYGLAWIASQFGVLLVVTFAVALIGGLDGDAVQLWMSITLAVAAVLTVVAIARSPRAMRDALRLAGEVLLLMLFFGLAVVGLKGPQSLDLMPLKSIGILLTVCLLAVLPAYVTPLTIKWQRVH
ncbi:MAG: hypothetical protein AMXMBFR84_39250 [Candidatus Hydrogenedentota bacterium]